MLSPFATKLDPPALRAGWLRMMLRVFRHHDRDGLYREMIALTERFIADAEQEAAQAQKQAAAQAADQPAAAPSVVGRRE